LTPKTAHSNLVGGMVWGIGQALHEQSQQRPPLRGLAER